MLERCMILSCVISAPESSPVIFPSAITSILSHSAISSSQSDETRTIDFPFAASLLMIS